ncbi:MAG: hypothetical protein KJ893_08045 [Candidatus Omnitrophica bacterium]|nr:hypothetical protein [Candidatus Omnitrophota bacterium]MBU4477928.1 hypothetical protein [Candidatus Omnitrophota bacterium]MCG2703844.1 hypothetical protein [Candidatus Omnitrophota bacterium]
MPISVMVIALFIIGFILLLIEAIIIPGFGFAGILGIVSLAGACYTAFNSLSPLAGTVATISAIIITITLVKILPKTSLWQKIRLTSVENKNMGYQVARIELTALINKTGKALTMLRPSGTALIDNKRYDVLTDGEFIEKNESIVVSSVEGNKIMVKKTT